MDYPDLTPEERQDARNTSDCIHSMLEGLHIHLRTHYKHLSQKERQVLFTGAILGCLLPLGHSHPDCRRDLTIAIRILPRYLTATPSSEGFSEIGFVRNLYNTL